MTTYRADDTGPRPPFPVSEGSPTVESVPPREAALALEIACPVCATFNPPLFRYCPQCGHLLRAARLREHTPVHSTAQQPSSRSLVCLLWLVVVVETGLLGGLWWHTGRWPWATSPPVLSVSGSAGDGGGTARDGSDASSAQRAARALPIATMTAHPDQPEGSGRQTSHPPDSAPVALTVFDREGDLLRHTRGTWFPQRQRVVTTFASMRGAYSAVIRFADHTTRPIRMVDRVDPEANVVVLALDAQGSTSATPPLTLEALARATYEETPAYHRYLADKRARVHRWEEALVHWQRVRTLEPALQPADAAAFTETVLHASGIAQADGRDAEVHEWLLDAVAWVPEDGDLRLRLADSFVARGAYSDAITQYEAALPLLPAHAAAITSALVRTYQTWGQGRLRQGHFVEAARLFRTALQLDSTNGELYVALGQAEWRQRALETAIEAFEAALTYAPGLQPEVEPYLTKARALQGGLQTVVIDFPPGSTRIEVPVVIDGRLEVPCIVDTGATVTLLPLWAAASLGYRDNAPADWVHVQTAGGPRRLPSVAVSRLEIQGLGVSNLPIVFGELPGADGSKGLLGMDVLRYFALVVDHEIGRMTLRPK